jgi:hypothetical protein
MFCFWRTRHLGSRACCLQVPVLDFLGIFLRACTVTFGQVFCVNQEKDMGLPCLIRSRVSQNEGNDMHQVLLQYLDCCRTKASEQLIRGAPHRRSPKVAFYGDTFVRPSSRGALVASLKCRHHTPILQRQAIGDLIAWKKKKTCSA